MVALLSEMPGDKDRNKKTCSGNPAWARQRYLYLFQNKSVDGARENNKDREKTNFQTTKGRLGKRAIVIHVQGVYVVLTDHK